ncbi:MAG: YfiR family protein [Pseudomonadota bacterium]
MLVLLGMSAQLSLAVTSYDDVKIAYVHKFLYFADWKDTASDTLDVCFLGGNPARKHLMKLSKQVIKGKRVQTHSFSNTSDLERCEVIIPNKHLNPFIAKELAFLKTNAIQIVDSKRLFDSSGHIYLKKKGNHLVFDVNFDRLHDLNVSIKAQLLSVADNVATPSSKRYVKNSKGSSTL